MELQEALYSTRATRRFTTDVVPAEVLWSLVEAATMAPTGANRQNWRFVVVTDRDRLAALAGIYGQRYEAARPKAEAALADRPNLLRSMAYLAEHFADVPAAVLVGGTGCPPGDAAFTSVTNWYGSLFPAVQNLILAARGHGLGTTITTLVLDDQERIRRLVDAPDDVTFVACLPVGYPQGEFSRPQRLPVAQVAYLNSFNRPFST